MDRCTRSSTDEGFIMKVPFCKTERFRKSYLNRIVYLWKFLPQNVRRDVDLESFMKGTDKILHVYLNIHFQETTLCCSMFLCCFFSNCRLLLNSAVTYYNVLLNIFTTLFLLGGWLPEKV